MARNRTQTEQPLPWSEAAALEPPAGGRPAATVPQGKLTYYVSGRAGTMLDPRIAVEEIPGAGDRAFWRIDVDLGNDIAPQLPGLSAKAIDLDELPELEGALEAAMSFRPRELAASYVPTTEKHEDVILKRSDGRKFRPLFLFPPEDRAVLFDTTWPWLLIGKVQTSDGKSGSGALVGDRLLLTARHVAPWKSIDAGNWWMKFTPHYWDGTEPFGSSFVSDIHWPTDSDLAHDYLVGRLYEPLGQNLGFFGAISYDDDWEDENVWASVGYAGDVAGGQRPAVQLGASINEDYGSGDGVAMTTQADLNHGESGGPFWAWFNGHAKIVGVISGETKIETNYGIATVEDFENAVSGGDHMIRLIAWGRQNWPA